MEMYFKTDTGWEDKTLTLDECVKWFKDHIDKDGNVETECLIFKDAGLKVNTDKTINWTMSDDSIDRDYERFDTTGWQLKEFKKNPVLQWSHDNTIPAIGKVANPHIKDERLVGKIEFDVDDAFAQKIERKVRAGYISAGSVGFYPIKVEIPDDDKDNKKPSLRLIYRKQELREFSICNVPANPNALVEQPEKTVDELAKDFCLFGDTSVESVKADQEEMAIDIKEIQKTQAQHNLEIENHDHEIENHDHDIENLKMVQMEMSDKIDKDDTEYYQSVFDNKTLPPSKASKESVFDE